MITPDLQRMIDEVTEEALVAQRLIVEVPLAENVELKVDHSYFQANNNEWALWRMDQVYGMDYWDKKVNE